MPLPIAQPGSDPRLGLVAHPVRFLFEMHLDFHRAPIHATPFGARMVFAVKEGSFQGPGSTAPSFPVAPTG